MGSKCLLAATPTALWWCHSRSFLPGACRGSRKSHWSHCRGNPLAVESGALWVSPYEDRGPKRSRRVSPSCTGVLWFFAATEPPEFLEEKDEGDAADEEPPEADAAEGLPNVLEEDLEDISEEPLVPADPAKEGDAEPVLPEEREDHGTVVHADAPRHRDHLSGNVSCTSSHTSRSALGASVADAAGGELGRTACGAVGNQGLKSQ